MTTINIQQIQKFISDYQAAETRKEQREIENEILELTVWGEHSDSNKNDAFAVFSKKQWDAIIDSVEVANDDKEIERLLRQPYNDLF